MSRRNATGQTYAPARAGVVAKQELQERWKHLELKPATLLHLQELLDKAGIAAAVTVTDVIAREKRPKMATMGMEWSFEELRLISLEGLRPHLVDLVRVALESFLAWRFIHLPEGAPDGVIEIILAVLFFVVGMIAVCLTCRYRSKIQASGRRSKRSSLKAPFGGVHKTPREKTI